MRWATVPHCGRQNIGTAAADSGRWNAHMLLPWPRAGRCRLAGSLEDCGMWDLGKVSYGILTRWPTVACVVAYLLRTA